MTLVDDVLVHLVHDGVDIIFDAQVGDELQLGLSEHLAAGIGGIADQDGFGILLEGLLQHGGIKVERRGHQGNVDGLAVGHDDLRVVVFKIGREQDHLVTGIGEGEDGIHHSLSRADGHHHFGVGVQLAAHEAAALAGQRLAEVGRAHGDGILVGADSADLGQTVGDLLGRIKIREALRQIDGAHIQSNAGHTADDRVCEVLIFTVHFFHARHSFPCGPGERLPGRPTVDL